MPKNLIGRALSFSHLAGLSAKKADDDEDKNKDKNVKKAADEDEDKKDQDHEDGDAKSSASDQDDDKSAEGDDPKDDDDKKGKKAKKAAGDDDDESASEDDDDEEMRGNSASAMARRRERDRCASILGSKAAARNIVLACSLAFETDLPRSQALAVLEGAPAAADTRTGRKNPNLGVSGESTANSQQAIAASWDSGFAKVARKKR